VLYKCGNATTPTTVLSPYFEIGNNSTATESLVGVTIRYYFTSNGGQNPMFQCNFANLGGGLDCHALSGMFGSWTGTKSDHYLEIAFTGGTIGVGGTTGEIQVQIYDKTYNSQIQADDYSFNNADTSSYAAWDHVTLYKDGVKYWGFEP
jgi:hypothetical protein